MPASYHWSNHDATQAIEADGITSWRSVTDGKFEDYQVLRAYEDISADTRDWRAQLDAKPYVSQGVKAWNKQPIPTPSKDFVRWWRASCDELKARIKEDSRISRQRATTKDSQPRGSKARNAPR